MSESTGFALETNLQRSLEAALAVDGARVRRRPDESPGWDVELKTERGTCRVAAHADEAWLILESAPDRDVAGSAVDWIAYNDGLAGGVKLALAAGDSAPHLRAEIPLDGVEQDLAPTLIPKLAATWRGFAEASARMSATSTREQAAFARSADDEASRSTLRPNGGASAALAERLGELGWPHSARNDGSCNVDLDIGEGFAQVNVAEGVDAAVELRAAFPEATSARCREAVSTLLLRCSGWVRMVRAAADPRGRARLEVVLPAMAGDADLSHALCALSMAMRFAGDEVALLSRDEALASRLLSSADHTTRGR